MGAYHYSIISLGAYIGDASLFQTYLHYFFKCFQNFKRRFFKYDAKILPQWNFVFFFKVIKQRGRNGKVLLKNWEKLINEHLLGNIMKEKENEGNAMKET